MEVYNFINELDFIPGLILVLLIGCGILNILMAIRGKPTKRIALKQSVNSYVWVWISAIFIEAMIFGMLVVTDTLHRYSGFPSVTFAGVFTAIGFIIVLFGILNKGMVWEFWKFTPEERIIVNERKLESRKQFKRFFNRVHLGFIGTSIKA